MVITTISILIITCVSGRLVRKKAMNNLSEAGKQRKSQAARWPRLVMGRESYTSKGLKYRRILLAIVILGLVLTVVAVIFNL